MAAPPALARLVAASAINQNPHLLKPRQHPQEIVPLPYCTHLPAAFCALLAAVSTAVVSGAVGTVGVLGVGALGVLGTLGTLGFLGFLSLARFLTSVPDALAIEARPPPNLSNGLRIPLQFLKAAKRTTSLGSMSMILAMASL